MNKLIIIGNLTRDPETRTVSSGSTVCSFTVAVNRRRSSQNQDQPSADYFRVSVWNKHGDVCQRYLAKGRKVCVVGSVSVSSYEGNDGNTRFSLDLSAENVEFLSPKNENSGYDNGAFEQDRINEIDERGEQYRYPENADKNLGGFKEVDDDDLPF